MKRNISTSKFRTTALLLIYLVTAVVFAYAKVPARGPVQSSDGPGSTFYVHESITHWESDKNHEKYHVFEPDSPSVEKAGFVLMIHDRMTPNPEFYMGQIRHLCRKGWIVLFPLYQGTNQFERHYMFNVIRSTKDFMLKIFARGKIELDREKFAITGVGCGAVLAVNTAACADYFGLPKPLAIMSVMPEYGFFKLLDLTGISRDSKLLVISGDRAAPQNAQLAHDIFYTADRVKIKNKALVYVLSDYYGQPPLIADQISPLSPENPDYERFLVANRNTYIKDYKDKFSATYTQSKPIDAYDWKVTYRMFDVLSDLVFTHNTDLTHLKKSKDLKNMGYWSDGKKLKNLIITDRP
ncbi:MAG: hypothetical protein PHF29_00200 [Candidatus Riflebacteria bacterium]|nr:hypothetical protein [Candidatus Riflebacteria bacterium]